jgi:lambda repressor-like predicted transcriptional regulator
MDNIHDITLRDENGDTYPTRIQFSQQFPYPNGGLALVNEVGGMSIFDEGQWVQVKYGEFEANENTQLFDVDGVIVPALSMTIDPTSGTLILQTMVVESEDSGETLNSAKPPTPVLQAQLILASSEWSVIKNRTNLSDEVVSTAKVRAVELATNQIDAELQKQGKSLETADRQRMIDELSLNLFNTVITADIPHYEYIVDKGLPTEAVHNVSNVQFDPRYEGVLMQDIQYDSQKRAYMSTIYMLHNYTTLEMDTGDSFDAPKKFMIDGMTEVVGTEMHYEPTNSTVNVIGYVGIPIEGEFEPDGQPRIQKHLKKQYLRRGTFQYVTITGYDV